MSNLERSKTLSRHLFFLLLGVYTVSTYFYNTKAVLIRRKYRNNSRTTTAFGLHHTEELQQCFSLWCRIAVTAWLESMTRLESQFLVTRTRLESHWKNGGSTRIESRFSKNDWSHSQWLESELFLQNRWVPDGQTQFVCTQTNEDFLLQWWSRLGESFCFVCLVVLCWILRINCPQRA